MTRHQWGGSYIDCLELEEGDALSGSHQGQCDDDIASLRREPYVAAQLNALDPDRVRRELKEYGAWEPEELADHDANLSRLLWCACCDIREEVNQTEA